MYVENVPTRALGRPSSFAIAAPGPLSKPCAAWAWRRCSTAATRGSDRAAATWSPRGFRPASNLAMARPLGRQYVRWRAGGLRAVDEDDQYEAMDWLSERRRLVRRQHPPVRFRHSRGGKRGRPVVVYRLAGGRRRAAGGGAPGDATDPNALPGAVEPPHGAFRPACSWATAACSPMPAFRICAGTSASAGGRRCATRSARCCAISASPAASFRPQDTAPKPPGMRPSGRTRFPAPRTGRSPPFGPSQSGLCQGGPRPSRSASTRLLRQQDGPLTGIFGCKAKATSP